MFYAATGYVFIYSISSVPSQHHTGVIDPTGEVQAVCYGAAD
jgi:hypothetical protein